MAQELFKEKVELYERKVAEEQKRRLFGLWQTNAVSFRELPHKYQQLLQKKRELGIKPLRAIPKMVLQDFPTIPFFELESEEEVLKQIEEWGKEGKLGKKLEEIENTLKTNTAYNSMRAWCIDFTYTSSKLLYDENMRRVTQSANNRSLPNRDLIYG